MDITRLIGETTEYDKKAALETKKPKSWCKRNSRMMWRKTDNSREELPEYVERSYHEALINGLAHRDYLSDNSAGRQHSLLSPLDCRPAKAGGAVNGGAYAPFILTVDWLGWLC